MLRMYLRRLEFFAISMATISLHCSEATCRVRPAEERDRTQNLDVPDLRLDLRRSRWRSRARYCARHAVGRGADELDLPGMRCAQRRLRDGSALIAIDPSQPQAERAGPPAHHRVVEENAC